MSTSPGQLRERLTRYLGTITWATDQIATLLEEYEKQPHYDEAIEKRADEIIQEDCKKLWDELHPDLQPREEYIGYHQLVSDARRSRVPDPTNASKELDALVRIISGV